MPYKQKHSPYWFIRIPDGNGNKVRKTSGTTDFKEAQALERRLNAEEYNRVTWGQEPARYFEELMARYLDEHEDKPNYTRNRFCLSQLEPFFIGKVMNDLTPVDINEYKRGRKVSDATIRKELILLSTAINYACSEWGWKISNPVKGRLPQKPPGRLRWLTKEDAVKLINAAKQKRQANKYLPQLIELALNTGMRKGELLGLEWSRVNFGHRLIYLGPEHQKNRGRDSIPLNDAAIRVLRDLQTIHKDPGPVHKKWVFVYKNKRIMDIKKGFREVCNDAKIKDFTFHDLRHTACAWMVQAGIPIREVADVMRHKDINTTMRYAHLAPENKRRAVEAINYDLKEVSGD